MQFSDFVNLVGHRPKVTFLKDAHLFVRRRGSIIWIQALLQARENRVGIREWRINFLGLISLLDNLEE